MPSIDASYRSLIAALPPRLREIGETLPWKLGLTPSPDGGWGDFVNLHPNRELPLYAAQAEAAQVGPPQTSLSLELTHLHCFVRSHHAGGFYWLLRDRLADGQVGADDQLLELLRLYGENWRETLAEAMGDAGLADLLIRGATSRWRKGTALERRLLADGNLHPVRYAAMVRDKLSWIAVPSQALLLVRGGAGRGSAFRHAHDLFLLSLQAVDDVIDRNEDRALRGSNVPAALGCSAGALLRAAPKLAARAAALAAEAGFTWFASWLGAFGRALTSWRLEGDILVDELEAIGIAGEIEEGMLEEDAGAAREAADVPAPAAAPEPA